MKVNEENSKVSVDDFRGCRDICCPISSKWPQVVDLKGSSGLILHSLHDVLNLVVNWIKSHLGRFPLLLAKLLECLLHQTAFCSVCKE